jgi:hypothetical protein
MIDIEKYKPDNLKNLTKEQLLDIATIEIYVLARQYPFMSDDLLIKRYDGQGDIISATYRSLNKLIRSGHYYEIVGTKFGEPKEPLFDIEKETEKINETDFIPIPESILLDKEN